MVLPLDEKESNEQEPWLPGIKRAVFVGVTIFDSVWRQKRRSKEFRQFYTNLPIIHVDRSVFQKLACRHGFENDEIESMMEPRMKDLITIAANSQKFCKKYPTKTVFILSCYASHGMI